MVSDANFGTRGNRSEQICAKISSPIYWGCAGGIGDRTVSIASLVPLAAFFRIIRLLHPGVEFADNLWMNRGLRAILRLGPGNTS